jgi:hypothetical protein
MLEMRRKKRDENILDINFAIAMKMSFILWQLIILTCGVVSP